MQHKPKGKAVYYVLSVCGYIATAGLTWYSSLKSGVTTTAYGYLYPNTVAIAVGIYIFFITQVSPVHVVNKRALRSVSDSMFGVYLCHPLWISVFDRLVPEWQIIMGVGQALVKTCVVFAASLAGVTLLRKVPFLREYAL